MEATPTRPLGPGRIVALALIALVVSGLAYLRFAPDAGSVSVPKGARAGDLTLEPCNFGTERGKYAADCQNAATSRRYLPSSTIGAAETAITASGSRLRGSRRGGRVGLCVMPLA